MQPTKHAKYDLKKNWLKRHNIKYIFGYKETFLTAMIMKVNQCQMVESAN